MVGESAPSGDGGVSDYGVMRGCRSDATMLMYAWGYVGSKTTLLCVAVSMSRGDWMGKVCVDARDVCIPETGERGKGVRGTRLLDGHSMPCEFCSRFRRQGIR